MADGQPSLDRIFDQLANRRRRYVLYQLNRAETAVVSLDEVADQVAEWERRWDDQDDRDEQTHRERVRLALHHNHLPKLADAGLVDYDGRSRTVRNWEEPSLERWATDCENELDHLRGLFV